MNPFPGKEYKPLTADRHDVATGGEGAALCYLICFSIRKEENSCTFSGFLLKSFGRSFTENVRGVKIITFKKSLGFYLSFFLSHFLFLLLVNFPSMFKLRKIKPSVWFSVTLCRYHH